VSQKLGSFLSAEDADDLAALTQLIESGAMAPVIDRTYPLGETAAAIDRMRGGRACGKVVVVP
jgi:NADPH:quinone reductase-like Zn-dependent oxidoreductase